MDAAITTLIGGAPAPADGRAPLGGAQPSGHAEAFGSALSDALSTPSAGQRSQAAADGAGRTEGQAPGTGTEPHAATRRFVQSPRAAVLLSAIRQKTARGPAGNAGPAADTGSDACAPQVLLDAADCQEPPAVPDEGKISGNDGTAPTDATPVLVTQTNPPDRVPAQAGISDPARTGSPIPAQSDIQLRPSEADPNAAGAGTEKAPGPPQLPNDLRATSSSVDGHPIAMAPSVEQAPLVPVQNAGSLTPDATALPSAASPPKAEAASPAAWSAPLFAQNGPGQTLAAASAPTVLIGQGSSATSAPTVSIGQGSQAAGDQAVPNGPDAVAASPGSNSDKAVPSPGGPEVADLPQVSTNRLPGDLRQIPLVAAPPITESGRRSAAWATGTSPLSGVTSSLFSAAVKADQPAPAGPDESGGVGAFLPASGGNAGAPTGNVASLLRTTVARYLVNTTSATSDATPTPTSVNSAAQAVFTRSLGLAPQAASDFGQAVQAPVADDVQNSTAAIAVAARAPFQLAQTEFIEPPLLAQNELTRMAQFAAEFGQVERLSRFSSGSGDASSSSSGDQRPQSQTGGQPGSATLLAAGTGLANGPSGPTDAPSFQAAAARAADLPAEPSTDAGPLSHSIVRVVKLQTTAGGGEMQLRLRPEHLGELTVSVRVEAGMVSAALRSDSPEVRAWLQQHQQDLRAGLKDQGLVLEQLRVDPDGRQQSRRDASDPQPERRPSSRRQEVPGRFEALM